MRTKFAASAVKYVNFFAPLCCIVLAHGAYAQTSAPSASTPAVAAPAKDGLALDFACSATATALEPGSPWGTVTSDQQDGDRFTTTTWLVGPCGICKKVGWKHSLFGGDSGTSVWLDGHGLVVADNSQTCAYNLPAFAKRSCVDLAAAGVAPNGNRWLRSKRIVKYGKAGSHGYVVNVRDVSVWTWRDGAAKLVWKLRERENYAYLFGPPAEYEVHEVVFSADGRRANVDGKWRKVPAFLWFPDDSWRQTEAIAKKFGNHDAPPMACTPEPRGPARAAPSGQAVAPASVPTEPVVTAKLAALEGPDADGSKADVAKAMARKAGAVKSCYEAALRDNPNTVGKLQVDFTVGTSGTIIAVTVSGADGMYKTCVEGKIKNIRGLPILSAEAKFSQSFTFLLRESLPR